MTPRNYYADPALRKLQPSYFDKVQAAVWSLVIVFATLSLIAILMWLQLGQDKPVELRRNSPSFAVPQSEYAGMISPVEIEQSAQNPGTEEFSEIDTPQLALALEAVTDAVSSIRAMLGKIDGDANEMGPGDGRRLVPGFTVVPKDTASSRWSIEYEPRNFDEYFDQLNAFGIELGFVSQESDLVEVLTGLVASPQILLTTKERERRVYFLHSNSSLRRWDLRMAQNAGVEPAGKIMVQFYPTTTTAKLQELEQAEAAARGVELSKIERTTFKVRATSTGYEYYVADIVWK